jgi:hypothetical protein
MDSGWNWKLEIAESYKNVGTLREVDRRSVAVG